MRKLEAIWRILWAKDFGCVTKKRNDRQFTIIVEIFRDDNGKDVNEQNAEQLEDFAQAFDAASRRVRKDKYKYINIQL